MAHQHMWCAQYVNQRRIPGVAVCATCRQEKRSQPPQNFRIPNMRKAIELAMIHPINRGRVIQATDFAGICPNCGETAYYRTSSKHGRECVVYNFRCMACGHKDVDVLD